MRHHPLLPFLHPPQPHTSIPRNPHHTRRHGTTERNACRQGETDDETKRGDAWREQLHTRARKTKRGRTDEETTKERKEPTAHGRRPTSTKPIPWTIRILPTVDSMETWTKQQERTSYPRREQQRTVQAWKRREATRVDVGIRRTKHVCRRPRRALRVAVQELGAALAENATRKTRTSLGTRRGGRKLARALPKRTRDDVD